MSLNERAPRNRTITLTEEDRKILLPGLRRITAPVRCEELAGITINQDLNEVIDYLPDEFADLVILDPPYNLTKDFGQCKFKLTSHEGYVRYLQSWLPKVMRCLKQGGSVYVCCDWRSTAAVYEVLSREAEILNRITWQRDKGRGALHNWKNCMEDIWFAVKGKKGYYFNADAVKQRRRVLAPYRDSSGQPKDWEETADGRFRLTYASNFWDDISIPYWSMPENTDHPTQKPEKLIAKLILASCPEDGMVLDPFLGSGTTSVVAKKLGRRYCGIELDREYALLALKRLAVASAGDPIQGYSDGAFWERNTLRPRNKKTE